MDENESKEIADRTKFVIVKSLGVDIDELKYPETTHLKDHLKADSMDLLELGMHLEDEFSSSASDGGPALDIDISKIELASVQNVINYVQNALEEQEQNQPIPQFQLLAT